MAAAGHTIVKAGPERLVASILFGALVLITGYASFLVLRPFLAGLAWASVLAIAVQPVFQRLKAKMTAGLAALLTTGALAVVLIAPATVLILRLADECVRLADRIASIDTATRQQWFESVERFWQGLQGRFPPLRGLDPIGSLSGDLLQFSKGLLSAAGSIAQNLLSFVGLAVFVLLALFFLLRDGPGLVGWLRRLSPLDPGTTDRLFEEVRALTESSVTATLLIAVAQGALGGIATAILGFPAPLIWGVAFGFCSLIPVLGTALVWVPAVLWLAIGGHYAKAVIMLLVSVLIVSQADNILRPILVSGRSRLNYEMSMLSVLGGVAAFGMLGLVLGPVVVAILTAFIEIYMDSKPVERGAS